MTANTTPRDLAAIAIEIRAREQRISDVIEIGGLLIEAQDHLDYGEWLPWVERELDFTERTAQNYMAAHRFAAQYETVSHSRLTRSALYKLACGPYEDNEIEAVLAVAAQERVTRDRLDEIVAALELPEETPDEEDTPEDESDDPPVITDAVAAWLRKGQEEEAADAAEAAAILDGPPPDLTPTPEAQIVDFITPAFNQAIEKLSELSTKPLAKFKTATALSKVAAVVDFLQHLAVREDGGNESAEDDPTVEHFCREWSRSSVKQLFVVATNEQRAAMVRFIGASCVE